MVIVCRDKIRLTYSDIHVENNERNVINNELFLKSRLSLSLSKRKRVTILIFIYLINTTAERGELPCRLVYDHQNNT